MTTTDRAAELEAIADNIRRNAIYADGPAHTQDMDNAARLDAQAAAIRRAALPLEVRCRPVLMVPVIIKARWAEYYDSKIAREEARGDMAKADLIRGMREHYVRSNPGASEEQLDWWTR